MKGVKITERFKNRIRMSEFEVSRRSLINSIISNTFMTKLVVTQSMKVRFNSEPQI